MPILPDSIRDARQAALDTLSQRLESLDLTPVLTNLIRTVKASALPHLGWQFHVDDFDSSEDVATQRAKILESVLIHRRKGTPWAVRRTLEKNGYSNIQIIEGTYTAILYDGAYDFDDTIAYDGGGYNWATFDIRLGATTKLTEAQFERIRQLLADVQPARCHFTLNQYDFLYDGVADYNESQTYDGILNG